MAKCEGGRPVVLEGNIRKKSLQNQINNFILEEIRYLFNKSTSLNIV